MRAVTEDVLREVVEPVVRAQGLDLEGVAVRGAASERRLEVLVDADGGVSLDQCAEVARLLSEALDQSPAMGEQPYALEVGSPGVSRGLTAPRHWRRAIGRLVRVERPDEPRLTGRLVEATETTAVLDVEGSRHVVELATVRRAKVQVEFRPMSDADDTNDSDDTATTENED